MVKPRNEIGALYCPQIVPTSDPFTPTTEEVRTYYSIPPGGIEMSPQIAAGFDRWLEQYTREVEARVRRESGT